MCMFQAILSFASYCHAWSPEPTSPSSTKQALGAFASVILSCMPCRWHVGICSEECAGTGEVRFALLGSSQPFSKKLRTLFIGSFWAMVTRVLCGIIMLYYFTPSNHSNTFYCSLLQPNRFLQMLLLKAGFICDLRDCLFRFLWPEPCRVRSSAQVQLRHWPWIWAWVLI